MKPRHAVATDAEEITRLTVTCHGGELTPDVLEVMAGDFRSRLGTDPDLIAHVIDAPAGGLACAVWGIVAHGIRSPKAPTGLSARLNNVSTDPEHRRRGYARATVQAFLDQAAAVGCWSVALYASEAGRPLYEGLGFVKARALAMTYTIGSPRR